jgi:hypothetical protein
VVTDADVELLELKLGKSAASMTARHPESTE